jgi:uncharacterized protein (TIGR00369 family)
MSWDPVWTGPRVGPAWITYCNGHPVAELLGLKTVASREGVMEFTLSGTPAPNPNGAVHGGLLAAALDHVLAVTAMQAMPDDGLPNTAGMNVQFLRPAMPTLKLHGSVSRAGRSLVFVRAEVYCRDDRLSATADGTFAIVTAGSVTPRGQTAI